MFRPSFKVGRGGRRGGVPKSLSALRQSPRASLPTGGRLSLSGSPRIRNPDSGSPQLSHVEENFSLVPGKNPFAFGMMIRLTPGLVEEIRRAEARGETAKIKFHANPKNASDNLINVGSKEFHFTWSKEFGDLCDIYEEKKSDKDGNGLLVESGCAWRKLNMQRILDESTTNHVKMLSVEADRKYKARKAIVLDHDIPSIKGQIKQVTAVDATSKQRMGIERKEPPYKRRKVDPLHAPSGGPRKSACNPGLPVKSKTVEKEGRAFSQDAVNISKSDTIMENADPAGQLSEEVTVGPQSGITSNPSGLAPNRPGNQILGSRPSDLQGLLINILRKNPKGMSIKALEKELGCGIPLSGKNILTKIATYQAPGRYVLKPGSEFEVSKGSTPGSGRFVSFSEDRPNQEQAHDRNFNETPVIEPNSPREANILVQVNPAIPREFDASMNVDIKQRSPNLLGGKKSFDHIDGNANDSSSSGSDSEDSSSDSESSSRSPSRSRGKSSVGSGCSSSDSGTSNQEGSDEDVDIMSTDDEVLKHKAQELISTFPMTRGCCQPVIPQDSNGHNLGKPSQPTISKNTLECQDDPVVPVQKGIHYQLKHLPEGECNGISQICKEVDVIKCTRIGTQEIDSRGSLLPQPLKECKTQAAGTAINMSGVQKAVSTDCGNGLTQKVSFSYENSRSYSKYEKDAPELKEPIKDLLQYREYAQEFADKYDSYRSINQILEKYRDEFERLGKEVNLVKGRDLEGYKYAAAQLRDSFSLYGSKHKRLKKIFVVLHAELTHLKKMMTEFVQKHSKGSSG
ncbi:hypothetical protein SAY86_014049 [Trapa natans]|uniref:OCEL domain-containing protein n=1 Tax=Trapa natans TaxID=22666 RepID=A0AAN7KVN6_TRANT|nr:hypothetical protein SAY86_014049 [Trapa natans]